MNRLTAMRVIAWLLILTGVGFSGATIVFGFVGPGQEIHAVHNAVVVSLIVVLTVPALVGVARAPEASAPQLLILGTLAIVGVVAMVISLSPDPFTLPVLLLIGVLWLLAPTREGAVPDGRPSLAMLVIGVAGLALFVPYVLGNAALQRSDQTSEHALFYHWVETAFYALAIPVLGLLAAYRPSGFRLATWCAGIALAILGAASVVFPGFASALPAPWSWVAFVGGLAFIGLGEWEIRQGR